MVGLFICACILNIVRPCLLRERSTLFLLALLSLATLVPAKALIFLSTTRVLPPGVVEFLTPLALAPLLTTVLIGGTSAVVVGLWTSFAASVLFGNSFTVFTMGLVVTTLAAHSAQNVRKRSGVFKAGLWVGLGQMLFALGLAALNQPEVSVVIWQALGSLATGIAVAGIALLLTPFFEVLFGITTDIKLLEYSDPGHTPSAEAGQGSARNLSPQPHGSRPWTGCSRVYRRERHVGPGLRLFS